MVQLTRRITGSSFTAEIGFYGVSFWLADRARKRKVRISEIDSVTVQPNGYTQLALRFRKDILVPTSHSEAVELVKELNALISERQTVELRRREAGREAGRRKDQLPSTPSGAAGRRRW